MDKKVLDKKAKDKRFLRKIILVPIGMFLFAYALVPLYDVFCDITGLNGRSSDLVNAKSDTIEYAVDESRQIEVTFLSSIAPGLPIKFKPKLNKVTVFPGETRTIFYIAENRSDKVVYGRAVPSVSPTEAALHFKKIECFCFTEQKFDSRKPVEMPVTFVIDPNIDEDVVDVTLSYNFFRIDPPK